MEVFCFVHVGLKRSPPRLQVRSAWQSRSRPLLSTQYSSYPTKLTWFRHLSQLSDTRPALEGSDGRVIRLKEEDTAHCVEATLREFVRLCPGLIKKGLGHAGHVMEVVESVSRSAFGGCEVDELHHSSVYFLSSFFNDQCISDNASYYVLPAKQTGNAIILEALQDIKRRRHFDKLH